MYGGSTTSILVNIPGEAASVVTCLDGYQMARQGKAGRALGISAFGSFIAGTLGLVGLTFLGPLTQRPCVWWRYRVSKKEQSGRGRSDSWRAPAPAGPPSHRKPRGVASAWNAASLRRRDAGSWEHVP